MDNLMADCIMNMFPDAVEDRQCYLVGDLFDLLQGTPREARDLTVYLKKQTAGHEGYALTTLSNSQDLGISRDQQQDKRGITHAADACDNLGTGEQVILQGEEVWHNRQMYRVLYLTKAVSDIRRRYLPDLRFTKAMILVGTLGNTYELTRPIRNMTLGLSCGSPIHDHLA